MAAEVSSQEDSMAKMVIELMSWLIDFIESGIFSLKMPLFLGELLI